ncbi:uncharacterized protein LOC144710995 [Wolffia australiana]
MMNALAMALVALSLSAAGLWSPPPAKIHATAGAPPIREGHRLIIVEYERESPQPSDRPSSLESLSAAVEEAKEMASELLPRPVSDAKEKPTAKDVICDAFGACKDKVSEIFSHSKEKAEEKVSEIVSRSKEKEEKAKELGKEKVSEIFSRSKEKAKELGENVTAVAAEARRGVVGLARRGVELVRGAPAAEVAAVAHVAAFATAYGTCVWVSFVSSQVLAGAVSRHQFGVLQSKLYPVYFRAMAYAVAVAAVAADRASSQYLLFAALGLVLVNLLLLEPKATKVMFKKMKMEKEEGRGRDMAEETTTSAMAAGEFGVARTTTTTTTMQETMAGIEAAKKRIGELDARLRSLNTYSSFFNILSLMALSWHLVCLARRIQSSCEPDGAR